MERLNQTQNAYPFTQAMASGFNKLTAFGGRAVSMIFSATCFVAKDVVYASFSELASIGKTAWEVATVQPEERLAVRPHKVMKAGAKRKRTSEAAVKKVKVSKHQEDNTDGRRSKRRPIPALNVFVGIMGGVTYHATHKILPKEMFMDKEANTQ